MIVVLLHTNSFIFFFFIIFLSFLSSFLLFRAVCHLFCVISPFILSRCVCLRYFARNALRSCTNIYYLFICFFFRHKRGVCASVITICWAHSFFMNTHTHTYPTLSGAQMHMYTSVVTRRQRTEQRRQNKSHALCPFEPKMVKPELIIMDLNYVLVLSVFVLFRPEQLSRTTNETTAIRCVSHLYKQ